MESNTCFNCRAGSAAGWGRQDDAGVVKVHASFIGFFFQLKLVGLLSTCKIISTKFHTGVKSKYKLMVVAVGGLTEAVVCMQVYETLTGVKVEAKLPVLKKDVVLKSLPVEWQVDPTSEIQRLNQDSSKTLVVLDDDPTGTQTVHDIEVLTEW